MVVVCKPLDLTKLNKGDLLLKNGPACMTEQYSVGKMHYIGCLSAEYG